MKKTIAFLLILILALASAASADSFTSLSQLQRFISSRSPDSIVAATNTVELSGTILELYPYESGNHWEMLIRADDPQAVPAFRYGVPVLIVHFRLHVDSVPFAVGDTVDVKGSLNALYSSPIIPWILADQINGSSDF